MAKNISTNSDVIETETLIEQSDTITSINDFAREMSARRDTPLGLLEVFRRNRLYKRAPFNIFLAEFNKFCETPN